MKILESHDILKRIPHRYPFLLVDRVIDLIPGQQGVGIKNVCINELYFLGHFPENPIMPGVLIIEACGQLAGLVIQEAINIEQKKPHIEYLASVRKFDFKNKVFPGDQLLIKAFNIQKFRQLIQISVRAEVKPKLIAEGVLVITNRRTQGEKL